MRSMRTLFVLPALLVALAAAGRDAEGAAGGRRTDPRKATIRLAPGQSISAAVARAKPGDVIALAPGSYKGRVSIENSGAPEKPIVIVSASSDPAKYAVIDGQGKPGDEYGKVKPGVYMKGAAWIVLERLKFRNCWNQVVYLENSKYITVRSCDILGGRHVVFTRCREPIRPGGPGTHHVLIEDCYWQQDERILTKWDWEQVHHGSLKAYNGSIYDGRTGSGGAVIRHNHLRHVFNGVQLWADSPNHQTNNEIYANLIESVRDNAIEPEHHAFNLHVYHNVMNMNQMLISIDSVKGGPIYLYGNVGYYSHEAKGPGYKNFSSVFKLAKAQKRYLDKPLHVYHNSWHYKRSFHANRFQRNVRHFNNAYHFTRGPKDGGLDLEGWEKKMEPWHNVFDNDCSNLPWPRAIRVNEQEQHGIVADPAFMNPGAGDFRLRPGSPCIDAGRVIPGFTQSYVGKAPDIGAYENGVLVDGPAFRYVSPPGGDQYREKPRIVRCRVKGRELKIEWSAEIDPGSAKAGAVRITADGAAVPVEKVAFPESGFAMLLTLGADVSPKSALDITFSPLPRGKNGQTATMWAANLELTPPAKPGRRAP